jgi:hypothetical protein
MDVARTVLPAEDVSGLGDVGQQRVVARVLPMMGIVAPEGPAHPERQRAHPAARSPPPAVVRPEPRHVRDQAPGVPWF